MESCADGEMRAQASGVPLANAFALVATLKDGRFIRLQEYYDHAEALEAAGLSEVGDVAGERRGRAHAASGRSGRDQPRMTSVS
jgi:hypothetical protein